MFAPLFTARSAVLAIFHVFYKKHEKCFAIPISKPQAAVLGGPFLEAIAGQWPAVFGRDV
jgi:hypothetical protein